MCLCAFIVCMNQAFNVVQAVPSLTTAAQVAAVLQGVQLPATPQAISAISKSCYLPIPIKQLLMVAEMARQEQTTVTPERFDECLQACGFDSGSGISLHADKNDLSFYSGAKASKTKKNRSYDEDDDDEDM